jgi:addiction module RelE/StbE family toxin
MRKKSTVLPIEWQALADADLLEILDFIGDRNEQAAEQLFARIAHALEQVAEHPYLYKPSQRIPGLREIVVHPNYVVFYRVAETCIEVVSVAHVRLEFPGALKNR